ncbi:DNA-directed RNA polymerase III subunit RPC10 [Picochlorum sp. SENEW3]|nr:DNA-directed RNA polymerase III subunit RPC10 [Picochlorum sp. SENEW3]
MVNTTLFCPTCANLLQVEKVQGLHYQKCSSCPYVFEISSTISKQVALERKEVDDVLGGEDAWKNVQKASAVCESCGNKEAYFREIQTRSADEPATLFFRCTNNKKQHVCRSSQTETAGDVAQLREEVAARTAAMANLEKQLLHVENLRAEELRTAISRFEELEEALLMAEKSILKEEESVALLTKQLEAKDKEISEGLKKLEVAMKQMHAFKKEAEDAKAREEEVRDAAKAELEASQNLVAKAYALLTEWKEDQKVIVTTDKDNSNSNGSVLKEDELETVLAELDLLRGELEAELETNEDAIARAEAAEAELEEIRKGALKPSKALDPAEMEQIAKKLAASQQELTASKTEEARLRILVEKLEAEKAEMEQQKLSLESVNNKVSMSKYTKELEERNRELVGDLSKSKTALEQAKNLLVSSSSSILS